MCSRFSQFSSYVTPHYCSQIISDTISPRKRLKKRKRHSSDHNSNTKHRKLVSLRESTKFQDCTELPNSSLYSTGSQLCLSGSDNNLSQQALESSLAAYKTDNADEPSQVNPAERSSCNNNIRSENVLTTPEKRLSSSRRKTATPKKYIPDETPGSFVQTLTDNINAKVGAAQL